MSVRARVKARKKQTITVPSPRRAFVELSDDDKYVDIWFPYSKGIKEEVYSLPGAHFKDLHQGGPKWRIPRDLEGCEKLRNIFGASYYSPEGRLLAGLQIGDRLRAWAKQEQQKRRNLGALSRAKDARLTKITPESRIGRAIAGKPIPELNLPPLPTGKPHPLMRKRKARPYQRADIKMMSKANVGNFNQPGTGKTLETIGSWIESGLLNAGPHLVIAPVKSLELVWLEECMMWIPGHDVYTDKNPAGRIEQAEAFLENYEDDPDNFDGVLCLNFDWIRLVKIINKDKQPLRNAVLQVGEPVDEEGPKSSQGVEYEYVVIKTMEGDEERHQIYRLEVACRDHKGNVYAFKNALQEALFRIDWATVTVDEFHKAGLNNRNTLFSLGLNLLKQIKRAALSGTPMGGKPRKLWPVLHWLEPEEYTSEWRWIKHWLDVDDDGHGKKVGDLKDGIENDFYKAHVKNIVRRLKLDVLPGLPPRVEQVVWCGMTTQQSKQYLEFERQLEIRIDEERLSAQNVLTEYMRLKQFANARQKMLDGKPWPTIDSGKLEQLWDHLDENGIRIDDPEPGARAIIGSESSRMVLMIHEWLTNKGIANDTLYGDTKNADEIIEKFKRGGPEPYVIVMTVQTGGVSLNLEEASSMHAIDETWNPDDLEQFFERGDRGSRTTPLRCYIYRTRGTIQEYIAQVNEGKKITNANVLDIRRKMHEMYDAEAA